MLNTCRVGGLYYLFEVDVSASALGYIAVILTGGNGIILKVKDIAAAFELLKPLDNIYAALLKPMSIENEGGGLGV